MVIGGIVDSTYTNSCDTLGDTGGQHIKSDARDDRTLVSPGIV